MLLGCCIDFVVLLFWPLKTKKKGATKTKRQLGGMTLTGNLAPNRLNRRRALALELQEPDPRELVDLSEEDSGELFLFDSFN